jgi:hypothetical protein
MRERKQPGDGGNQAGPEEHERDGRWLAHAPARFVHRSLLSSTMKVAIPNNAQRWSPTDAPGH